MLRSIRIQSDALSDMIDIAYQIAEDSLAASRRFTAAAEEAYEMLAEMPGVGASREFNNPRLSGLRMFPVQGFRNYLIFYQATDVEITIIRVLHGARDIESLFSTGETEDDEPPET